jgi:hypothetical protein
MVGVQELLFVLIGLAAAVASWRALRAPEALWTTGNWLLFASQPFVYAVPRYTLTLFPLFVLVARASSRPSVLAALLTWSLLFQGLFIALFVQGRWAF